MRKPDTYDRVSVHIRPVCASEGSQVYQPTMLLPEEGVASQVGCGPQLKEPATATAPRDREEYETGLQRRAGLESWMDKGQI